MTISQAYQQLLNALVTVYEVGEATGIARIVFEDEFGIRNLQRKDELPAHQLSRLSAIQSRLLNHEPVQYILGTADFFGLKFKVDPHVLIPRQETEELVDWILKTVTPPREWHGKRVLDIGTGSGCIAVALKSKAPYLLVEGVDISEDALRIARENAEANGVIVNFFRSDILNPESWSAFPVYDLIVSNPPYILRSETELMPENVLRHEPPEALFTEGEDPLVFYRAITLFAAGHLADGGCLFFETNEFHARDLRERLLEQGLKKVALRQDINGRDRMIKAVKG